jgi:palmitoyltransferase ZDHHC9/14/18
MTTNKPPVGGSGAPDDGDFPRPQFPTGPPSIISSRMTDIASEDGDAFADEQTSSADNPQRRSVLASESRPGTAKTGLSSSRGAWSQATPLRRGLQRGSLSGSVSGSVSGRPPSSTSRSHVPSLTSHAFFHPMSSQKLQAQRSASRPSTMNQQHGTMDEAAAENRAHAAQQRGVTSSPLHRIAREPVDDADIQPPPSRGTEMTEQETYDRITANTSPTHGHTAGSLTESVRPLHRKKPDGPSLSIDVDKTNKSGGHVATPMKSPRSFRSSLFIPKGESANNQTNRSMPGAEKLSSGASSPQLTPVGTSSRTDKDKSIKNKLPNIGRNHEYFEGNTFFCIGGRLQNTRHRPINIATGSFVVIPAVLFFIFSAPYLWHEVSPAVPIIFAYIFYICISSFLHASGSDPGVSSLCLLTDAEAKTLTICDVDLTTQFAPISAASG